MSVYNFTVNIFISQINTARESYITVDNTDFTVIPVVVSGIQNRTECVKFITLDSLRPHLSHEIARSLKNAAETVIHKPDVKALGSLFLQNFNYGIKHLTTFDNKILHKNEFFRLAQFLKHNRKHILSQRKKFGTGIAIHRCIHLVKKVIRLHRYLFINHPQFIIIVLS